LKRVKSGYRLKGLLENSCCGKIASGSLGELTVLERWLHWAKIAQNAEQDIEGLKKEICLAEKTQKEIIQKFIEEHQAYFSLYSVVIVDLLDNFGKRCGMRLLPWSRDLFYHEGKFYSKVGGGELAKKLSVAGDKLLPEAIREKAINWDHSAIAVTEKDFPIHLFKDQKFAEAVLRL
jgi:hypothetical protein